jgi:ZIP family zinc transporter
VFTLCGGLVALRYKGYSHIFAGLTAGVLISVVFLEMIPEILDMNPASSVPLLWIVIGFVLFHIFEKIFALHRSHGEEHHEHAHTHPASRTAAVWALIFHSLLDGLSIGLAYQVSPVFGSLLAIGVIAHDFSDGFNTISLTAHGPVSRAKKFLMLDALAPAVGAVIGLYIIVPQHILAILLSLFAGILLYVATGDILPEAHCAKKKHTVQHLIALVIGVAYIAFIVSQLN